MTAEFLNHENLFQNKTSANVNMHMNNLKWHMIKIHNITPQYAN